MLQEIPFLGEALSAIAPMTWAVAVILFRVAGREVSALALNLLKNSVGLVLLVLTLVIIGGQGWLQTPLEDVVILIASGVVGLAMADTLFLWSLNLIGAARTAVVSAAYPVSVVALSMIFLGERYEPLQWVGAGLVMAALFLNAVPEKEEDEDDQERAPVRGRRLALGLGGGMLAMVLMSVGIVMAKPSLEETGVVWASVLRLGGGQVALMLAAALHPGRRAHFRALLPSRAWRAGLPASIIGTYLAYMLWLGGMKYADVSVAAVLNQLSIVYIAILAAVFLRERLTPWKIGAILLGLAGSVIVALG